MEFSHFITLSKDHSIFYYLLILFLSVGVLQALSIGGLFFLKHTGDWRSNACYGLLLITFGLTLLHYIFLLTDLYTLYPKLYFVPIYYTLSFPILLFYHVKLSLYPQYRMRWTDAKHFVLPVGQFIFFCVVFFQTVEVKSVMGRYFYNPFFGAFEQLLYLVTFFAYTYFAYRYVRHKRRRVQDPGEARKVLYAENLLKILFVLFSIHTAFILSDYISYEFLDVNLRSSKAFAGLGILSFAALLFWLGIYGFQILFWGRKVFRANRT